MAPYCAIPRDYLSDTPLLRGMGFLVSQHGQLGAIPPRDTARLSQRYPPIARYGVFGVSTWPIGCDTPSPFSERFPPWRACEVEVRYPPPHKRGISAILARYPMKQGKRVRYPPLRYYLERVLLRKIPTPIKIKSALPPPPNPKYPPPKTRNFMDTGFSCRTDAFFPGVHKIGAAISGPGIADKKFTDTRIFLNCATPLLQDSEEIRLSAATRVARHV